MTFKLNKLAALVGVGFGVLTAPAAFADTLGMAQAVRQLSNFGLYKFGAATPVTPAGVAATAVSANLLNVSDFTQFQVLDNASTNARLNGVLAGASTSVNSVPPSPPVNLPQACIGTCGYAEDDYMHHNTVTGTFARSDMKLQGVLVGGIQVPGQPPGTFEATPASSNLLSEVQILGGGSANSNTSSGTDGSVIFTLASAGRILIDFNANDWLYAIVDPAFNMFAATSLGFRLTANNSTVFSWSPDGSGAGGTGSTVVNDACNLNAQVNATTLNATLPQSFACAGRFSALTPELAAGVVYNLTFFETTAANGTVAVPEPGSLALVGAALAGLGFARRRRAAKAE